MDLLSLHRALTRRRGEVVCAVVLATAAVLFASGPARASVTFGSTLANAPTNPTCGVASGSTGNCTIRQLTLASTAAGGLTAPHNGVVVRWRVRVNTSPFVTALTMTPRTLDGDTAVSSGAVTSVPLPSGTYTFESRLPILAGHYFGLDLAPTALGGSGNVNIVYQAVGVGVNHAWSPRISDGQTAVPSAFSDREYLYNADIEPDADVDGFGDESQDACPVDPAAQIAPCPDIIAPVLSAAKRRGARGFSVNGSESGALVVRLFRAYSGRSTAAGTCSRKRRSGRRCKAYKQLRKVSVAAAAGRTTGVFTRRKLTPGSYRLTFTLTDGAGNMSVSATQLNFRIKPKRR